MHRDWKRSLPINSDDYQVALKVLQSMNFVFITEWLNDPDFVKVANAVLRYPLNTQIKVMNVGEQRQKHEILDGVKIGKKRNLRSESPSSSFKLRKKLSALITFKNP